MEAITAVVILPDIDHPAGDDSIAKDTDSPVIKLNTICDNCLLPGARPADLPKQVSVHSGCLCKQEINFINQ
jgi:hypothetical protein